MSGQRLGGLVLLCLAVGASMAYLRFDGVNIALALAATAVVGVVGGRRELGHDLSWPALPGQDRGGHRHEVSQLSWSLTGRDGRVSDHALRRLREVAATRLRLASIDPDDDAAVRAVLGVPAWRVLRSPASAAPTVRALDACLTALDRLEGVTHEP